MISTKVLLNSIDTVKNFVNMVTKIDVDVDLVSGKYIIDAKSIMGIFSIDLSRPIEVRIHKEQEYTEEILEQLKDYLV